MRNSLVKKVVPALFAASLMLTPTSQIFAKEFINNIDGNASVDVNAKIAATGSTIYRADVEWGKMEFVYNSDKTWNPDTHTNTGTEGWDTSEAFFGTNNKITVTNHSNAGIKVSYEYAVDDSVDSFKDNVVGNFFENNNDAKTAAGTDKNSVTGTKVEYQLATAVDTELTNAPAQSTYFALSGAPKAGGPTDFTKVGNITVTIAQP